MRALFSLATLIVVVAALALAAKKQLTSVAVPAVPSMTVGSGAGAGTQPASLQGQLHQLQRDVSQAVLSSTSRAEP
ncbi:hypothetical protein [Caldimonas aquatica]|uniref:Uncharacterized protein n=1 Tax=Caldimonas aquatica TaxID=376175 RepID=A0ABY6MQ71_9BURK|nr:hypothetical protein [Schlegelella aquatica]UZD53673.1 hypothetical protein OMP39_08135 [Schlegelella aquatica]